MLQRSLRGRLREVVAIIGLVVLGTASTLTILQSQRLRVPLLEPRPFELKAEFETAQAVVPGQGQTIRVAGIRIGDVEQVELEDGVGVVTFGIDRDAVPIYRNATVLMRPTTGLKDMFFELDPGTPGAGEYRNGDTIPAANTAPDNNLDQILAGLDRDTRSYLRLLLVGAGEGVRGRGRDLGRVLAELGPINGDLRRLNSEVAGRSGDLASLINKLRLLSEATAGQDEDLTRLVASSNATLGAAAAQSPDLSRAVALLPGTLGEARHALDQLAGFANELRPTAAALRPFARRLPEIGSSLNDLSVSATPALRDPIRPFIRAARIPTADVRVAADRYAGSLPNLTSLGREANAALNTAAYNPRGAEPPGTPGRDEGYLFWLAWNAEHGNSIFSAQDANGLFRRIYTTGSCANLADMLGLNPMAPMQQPASILFSSGGPCN
jgi:phospholipid/cholesterol/gamma-HCH transport system substrate-binding protein